MREMKSSHDNPLKEAVVQAAHIGCEPGGVFWPTTVGTNMEIAVYGSAIFLEKGTNCFPNSRTSMAAEAALKNFLLVRWVVSH